MPAKKDVASTSTADKGRKGVRIGASSGRSQSEKPTELLSKQEFQEHFCILNDIFVHLVDEDPTSIEKEAREAIFFTKEQFNVGLHFLLLSLFK